MVTIAFFLCYKLIDIDDKVERYINAIVIWTLFIFATTEVLSVFKMITVVNLWLCWIGFNLILVILNIFRKKGNINNHKIHLTRKRNITKINIVWFIFALGMICLAVKTVPYNWDSMTYHLPRLFYWLQNGTVGHYAVHNDRQVASPVLGAFVNLQIYTVMNQNDIFINLLQCFSFLTNGVLVYHITKKIKCSESFCVLSAVLFYS